MIKNPMSRYTSIPQQRINRIILLCFILLPLTLSAQDVKDSVTIRDVQEGDSLQRIIEGGKAKATKYIPTQEDMKQTFFQGFTVSADILNMGLYFLSNYGNLEASLRLNLLNTYFPVAEVGMGRCNKTDDNTKIHFSTNAPYFKIGCDYNILKNKWQTNKLFVGVRYGLTNFNYSFDGPDQVDPNWKDPLDPTKNASGPLDVSSLNATSHYLEVVFGCQVKIWSFIHMGWSARYKKELHTTKSIYSHPYYIPGYGTTVNGSLWSATYNISFDLNWGKKKPTVKEVIENAVEDIKDPNAPQDKAESPEEQTPPVNPENPETQDEKPAEQSGPAE